MTLKQEYHIVLLLNKLAFISPDILVQCFDISSFSLEEKQSKIPRNQNINPFKELTEIFMWVCWLNLPGGHRVRKQILVNNNTS